MLKSLYSIPVVIYKGIVINAGRHLVEHFTLVSLNLNCIFDKQEAHVGHCRSPEYNERVKNLTSESCGEMKLFRLMSIHKSVCVTSFNDV